MDTIERILHLQEQAEISNKDLEKQANLANGSVTNWKKRRYSPSVEAIVNLAKFFNVTTDYLLCLSNTQVLEKSISYQNNLTLTLAEDETWFIQKLRKLDDEGKTMVRSALITETRRIAANEKENVKAG